MDISLQYPLDIMNLTPIQSGSKCSSDFSIERILSEDKRREEHVQSPNWLCCTRYQPPRLPRSSNACRSRRSGRHARVPFTATQAAALEAAYTRSPYLAPPALRALAAALQLRDDRIKIWFQNRRARERRERTGNLSPPKAVTLPSTNLKPIQQNEIWSTHQNHQNFEFVKSEHVSGFERTNEDTSLPRDSRSSVSSISDDESSASSLDIETVND
ncbi:homeobox protein MSH-A-like [Danaus plexippus]|uniref:homeobox protein MSH-A-like n=1 Tax=Danaus plexippus TaxID=13037 RepID=UPI000239D105|nr:homeobox protein MSH-A-like [Danaus plexippus]